MIALCLIAVCGSALFAQWRAQEHELKQSGYQSLLHKVEERVSLLESRKTDFDSAAFEDLKNKVEVMKMAHGLGSRSR